MRVVTLPVGDRSGENFIHEMGQLKGELSMLRYVAGGELEKILTEGN